MKSRPFTMSETHALLAHAAVPRDSALFTTLATTGMRVSEALALTWDAVMQLDGTFRPFVLAPVHKARKGPQHRLIPMSEALMRSLSALRCARTSIAPHDYIFRSPGPGNYALTPRQAARLLSNLCKQLGIPGPIGTHSFRKWLAAEIYRRADNNITLVQVALGHKSPASTLYYLSLDSQKLRRSWESALVAVTGRGLTPQSAPPSKRPWVPAPRPEGSHKIADLLSRALAKIKPQEQTS